LAAVATVAVVQAFPIPSAYVGVNTSFNFYDWSSGLDPKRFRFVSNTNPSAGVRVVNVFAGDVVGYPTLKVGQINVTKGSEDPDGKTITGFGFRLNLNRFFTFHDDKQDGVFANGTDTVVDSWDLGFDNTLGLKYDTGSNVVVNADSSKTWNLWASRSAKSSSDVLGQPLTFGINLTMSSVATQVSIELANTTNVSVVLSVPNSVEMLLTVSNIPAAKVSGNPSIGFVSTVDGSTLDPDSLPTESSDSNTGESFISLSARPYAGIRFSRNVTCTYSDGSAKLTTMAPTVINKNYYLGASESATVNTQFITVIAQGDTQLSWKRAWVLWTFRCPDVQDETLIGFAIDPSTDVAPPQTASATSTLFSVSLLAIVAAVHAVLKF